MGGFFCLLDDGAVRESQLSNELAAERLGDLVPIIVRPLTRFHPLVERLRGGINAAGKLCLRYAKVGKSHFDLCCEIHSIASFEAIIKANLYNVNKKFEKI